MAKTNSFNRFDVVSDDSDHSYLSSKKSGAHRFSNSGSEVFKKIMKEWRILEQNLPESIYVRVYEKRIDLLRAVIVGAAGTPYHDGLFFFDISLPPDYPNHPPDIHYRSFGLRLNPNLYASGRVCLSLINTWEGRKCEKWNPKQSTLLQVLLSIQALVLNEKPFFNEPGSDFFGRALVEKKSQAYNENAFALTCQTTIYLIRKPPKNFEIFVKGHFSERAHAILRACNVYVNGRARVGYYSIDGSCSSPPIARVSDKFKNWIQKLYPQLVKEFGIAGASLGTYVEQLNIHESSEKQQETDQKKKGIFKSITKRIKQALGLKKSDQNGNEAIKAHKEKRLNKGSSG
ncbi:hypothetical protein L6164_013678 [Bauhinia variegata]|uniref:Uncharacterized protein n=1 Tax=Bauhinia variegata TaxID=167791 RepID=A0ACB9NF34_BAUVA|nr:hypothetical protein L6164_013678 [Bauhinia variegata]